MTLDVSRSEPLAHKYLKQSTDRKIVRNAMQRKAALFQNLQKKESDQFMSKGRACVCVGVLCVCVCVCANVVIMANSRFVGLGHSIFY